MKILVITESLSPLSGWGRYSLQVVTNLKAQGEDVEVAVISGKRSVAALLQEVWRLRQQALLCDVVHALDGWPYGVLGYGVVLGRAKKLFITGIGPYSLPQGRFLKRFLVYLALRKAYCVFAISHYTRNQILKAVPSARVKVVPMGLTPLLSPSEEEREIFRQQFGLAEQRPIILTVGEVKGRKGQYDTVRALPYLLPQYPQALYVMVGKRESSSYQERINSFIAECSLQQHVLFIADAFSDKQLAFFYNEADVVVLNSRNSHGHFEGFGLTITEAGQFGVPAVGSEGCGIEDAIVNGVTGLLARQGDEKDIAEKIGYVLENKKVMGQAASKYAAQFSWEKTVLTYLKSYRD